MNNIEYTLFTEMKKLIYDNKLAEAEIELEKIIQSRPNFLEAAFELALVKKKLAYNALDLNESEVKLSESVDILSKQLTTENKDAAAYQLGLIHFNKEEYDLSAEYLRSIKSNKMRTNINNLIDKIEYASIAYFKKVKELENDFKYDEAFELLKKINKMAPNNYYVIFELGRFEKMNNNYEKATEYFNSLIGTPNQNMAITQLLLIASFQKRYYDVVAYFEKIKGTSSEDFAKNSYEDAKLAIQEIESKISQQVYDMVNEAKELLANKNLEEALIVINEAEKLDLTNAHVIALKATILKYQNKKEEALVYFEKLLPLESHYHLASLQIGKIYFELRDFHMAKKYFSTLFETKYEDYVYEKLLIIEERLINELNRKKVTGMISNLEEARKLIDHEKIGAAYELLEQNYEENPIFSESTIELASLERKYGNLNRARCILKDLIEAKNNIYAVLELAKVEADFQNYFKAFSLLDQIATTSLSGIARAYSAEINNKIKDLPLNEKRTLVNNRYEMAVQFIKENDYDSAEYELKEGAVIFPSSYKTLRELGRINILNKKYNDAREYFDKCAENTNSYWLTNDRIRLEILAGEYDRAFSLIEELGKDGNEIESLSRMTNLCIKMKDYKRAYRLFTKLSAKTNSITGYNSYLALLNQELSLPLELAEDKSYTVSQILNYSSAAMIEHVSEHLDFNDKEMHSVFYPENNVMRLSSNIALNPEDIIESTVADKYLVKYPKAGLDYLGNETDYVAVITIAGTKKVLTVYPARANLYSNYFNEVKSYSNYYPSENCEYKTDALDEVKAMNLKLDNNNYRP